MDEQPSKSIHTSTVSGDRPRSTSPTTGDGVGEDETQEDEPSSSFPQASRREELDNFRQQWKKELANTSPNQEEQPVVSSMKDLSKSTEPSLMVNENYTEDPTDNIYKQAKSLYLNGVHEERLGRLYEDSSVSDLSSEDSGPEDSRSASDDDEPTEILDLFSHIERVLNKTGTFRFCKPAKHQNSTHLSELPHEIFTYILKWVVSSDLDFYSLEEMSKVCRGFYISTRDSGVWRLACLRVWGVNCGLPNKYGSWRSMFIYRPHLWFHGAYISKTSYVRYGESSFQDSNYRPVYIVDYFRYLRFFPDGVVLMLTTPDDPYQSLSKLRQKRARHPTVMSGHYRLVGSVVTVILKRPKTSSLDYLGASSALGYSKHKRQPLRPKMGQDLGEESFHIELEIQAVKQRSNFKLVWKHYSLHRLFRNCQETVSEIDINPANFPPFLFSRVKSFNVNSEFPLQ